MLVKKIGQNKYRKANLWERLKLWGRKNEDTFYVVGSCVVGVTLIIFFILIMGGIY